MKLSLSRAVVGITFVAAAAGWFGAGVEPAGQAQAAGEVAVRDRAAWQPSPVPSTSASSGTTETTTASAASAAIAPPVVAAPVVPAAPVTTAVTTPTLAQRLTSWLNGLLGRGSVTTTLPTLDGASTVIPMADLLTHDALEAQFNGQLPAQRGEWRTVTFFSRALGREVSYMAWLPPGYATSKQTYPSLYLLHGVGSAEAYGVEEWLGYALTEDLDRMLAAGLIDPMIVILPNGEQGYWINHAAGGPQWADFVALDLVTHVDATFRTTATREGRAIGGLSMGGHGAVQIAYNHPELFSVAGAHSPTIRTFETSPEFFGDAAHFAQYDPISLAQKTKAVREIATWIDVGADDKWRAMAQALGEALVVQGAPIQFRVLEGEHEGWYWKHYLPEYLSFYSRALS